MAKFIFEKCCCFVDLRLGCFIFAYLEAVFSAIGIIVLTFLIVGRMNISNNKDKKTEDMVLLAITISLQVLNIGCFAFAIVLLSGLLKGNSENVKSYLMYSVFDIFTCVVLLVLDISFLKFRPDVVSNIFDTLLKAYILLIIRSYYYKMEEEDGA